MINIEIKFPEDLFNKLDGLEEYFNELIPSVITDYIVGTEHHGLMHEPYYKHINRYAGFPGLGGFVDSAGYHVPPGYASAKQHRYVMGAIARGEINPGQDNRTHNLSSSWTVEGGNGRYLINNNTSYGKYVQGQLSQTIMHKKIGWRKPIDIALSNIRGAIRAAQQALNRHIKGN